MDIISSAQARSTFPDLVGQATYGKRRFVITRRGKKVAAIVPIEDLERLLELEDSLDIEKIEDTLKNEEFESWNKSKKEIMQHLGITKNDIQRRDLDES
jgi:prevent-host-death family protein